MSNACNVNSTGNRGGSVGGLGDAISREHQRGKEGGAGGMGILCKQTAALSVVGCLKC